MKRILLTAATATTLFISAAFISAAATRPEEKPTDFGALFGLAMQEAHLDRADSILTVWQNRNGEDPDLYAARFNIMMVKALLRHSAIAADSAIAFIDRGIAEYPGRLDFRLDKSAALIETGDTDGAVQAIVRLLDYGKHTGYAWTMPEGADTPYSGEEATVYGVLDIAAMLLEQDSEEANRQGAAVISLLAMSMPRYSNLIREVAGADAP